jgi:transcriptional regulator with GAF, ATPase, and Fis domain
MLKLFDQLAQIATTDAPVLITGETGTGKELIARELHTRSLRQNKDLVTLNCSAIPENLLESELFGHEKGAFTGADKDKPGWFEMADQGTIFLDEIGELSPATQAKLLRVIQFGESTPVGSKRTRKIDVRLLTATNRDLPALVRTGKFRKDLYFRLNVFELCLPPLRERGHDIIALAEHFLELAAQKANKRSIILSENASALLLDYPFPGNVRELENIIQRAIFFCKESHITAEDLQLLNIDDPGTPTVAHSSQDFKKAKSALLDQFEKEFLTSHLNKTKGNISLAAQNAGMYKKNFIDKMKRHNIRAEQFKM